ncbi:hypothetical protein FB451DRAFT_1231446 [Mycena latifolia]|nr:hypothetical protein FB451DRAFT_1231446 [Mycena latifolia]
MRMGLMRRCSTSFEDALPFYTARGAFVLFCSILLNLLASPRMSFCAVSIPRVRFASRDGECAVSRWGEAIASLAPPPSRRRPPSIPADTFPLCPYIPCLFPSPFPLMYLNSCMLNSVGVGWLFLMRRTQRGARPSQGDLMAGGPRLHLLAGLTCRYTEEDPASHGPLISFVVFSLSVPHLVYRSSSKQRMTRTEKRKNFTVNYGSVPSQMGRRCRRGPLTIGQPALYSDSSRTDAARTETLATPREVLRVRLAVSRLRSRAPANRCISGSSRRSWARVQLLKDRVPTA